MPQVKRPQITINIFANKSLSCGCSSIKTFFNNIPPNHINPTGINHNRPHTTIPNIGERSKSIIEPNISLKVIANNTPS